MMNIEFKEKLAEAFKSYVFMKDRNYHTVNELLYVLEHEFHGQDFNISICTLDNSWWGVPCLDAFVDIKTRGIWFTDDDIVFEVDEIDEIKYNCITVYERKDQ